MGCQYCDRCDIIVDLDWNVEHFDDHSYDDGWRDGNEHALLGVEPLCDMLLDEEEPVYREGYLDGYGEGKG